ncbi:G_PROTEIN_RECEP_F1_2 domain-containing protein [Meloidogyne graminicola]|uniref:G_PROTEIN_RECEP_F1_2 domain-containing protein n=1 Tax=Meloidogyne graminicola TaxID=189291 RepID=A0A8S9ZG31_9BILA|nr:G_PROTEIN_RECEP_F1_2 domain-containing protein [Meloidogyne graminicola]
MRFFFQLISLLYLLKIADEGFLTGPKIFNNLNENCFLLNVSIAIIGAGFSGLSAFNRLAELGLHNVQIFEASNRVGGRVFPLEFENGIFLQQGAEFINGKNNPIYEAALRLGNMIITGQIDDSALISEDALFVSPPECQIPQEKLEKFAEFSEFLELNYAEMALANKESWSTTISELFDRDYANFLNSVNASFEDRLQYNRIAQVYRNYYEGEWSAPIVKLAVHNYAQWKDGSQSFPFNSYTLNSLGYQPILAELSTLLPKNKLNLNTLITQIDYKSEEGIRLKIQKKNKNLIEEEWLSTKFDFVIITVPIGHLKRFSSTLFYPQLPTEKLKIIEAIGFGTIQKVFLIYDKPFWPENMTSLVALSCNNDDNIKGRIKAILHTLQPHPWAKDRVLVLWLSGDGPHLVNSLTDENLSELLTKHLREVLPDINVHPPTKIIRLKLYSKIIRDVPYALLSVPFTLQLLINLNTKWLDDSLFFGSYTYITPEASLLSKDPFSLIAEPIYSNKGQKLKLLFAGEGTHSQMFQTTIGAYESGQREANRIAEYLIEMNNNININYK